MNLYNFDNNTELICNQIESETIYIHSKILEAEEDSTDKAYIYYYNNMTYQTTCKGKHSTWLLLNDHNRIVGIQKENRVNLNISEHSRMICIDYECYNMNSINTTLCTRVIRKDLTFISYEYDSNSSYNKLITVSIITFVVLVGIILILLSALLCCIFKKPRPPMPLPEQATDSNILYSEIYDHINRI
ncbi:uncharacterized protein LOC131850952 [Achroia grisella]|uniref:uncharacterized protein LOC131850952 n=1 Tax=Achroia grisella TaxID=688607 RepID=UPI0027D2C627|nr:uncharacterized protein LOC131850952 [Achroia grisella]